MGEKGGFSSWIYLQNEICTLGIIPELVVSSTSEFLYLFPATAPAAPTNAAPMVPEGTTIPMPEPEPTTMMSGGEEPVSISVRIISVIQILYQPTQINSIS